MLFTTHCHFCDSVTVFFMLSECDEVCYYTVKRLSVDSTEHKVKLVRRTRDMGSAVMFVTKLKVCVPDS